MAVASPSSEIRAICLLFLASLTSTALADETVACHYTYGGETSVLTARPTTSPYRVPGIAVGSYFRLRVVFQKEPADLASIKIYTYADQDDGPVPIHQASYPYPPATLSNPAFGFTGRQAVYEPLRDSELEYWCQMEDR